MAHAILFQHSGFRGAHKHVFRDEPNLNPAGSHVDDPTLNDDTSSIVILEGDWEFFADWEYQNKLGETLGPGLYPNVDALGPDANDKISSLRPVYFRGVRSKK
jgi:hypothetical protein